MNAFTRSISRVLKGAARSFRAYPAAMISALAFAVVAIVRIQLDWPQQEAYNFLFNCLHFALALGAVFGLTAVAAVKSKINDANSFRIANLVSAVVTILTFALLYFFGGADSSDAARVVWLSGIAEARVVTAMFVSLIIFVVIAGYPKEKSDFAKSFFMTHKAFFIALLYGIVLFLGGSAVAGAVEVLLYKEMSAKVYMHIGTIAGFLAYAIFIGYFPDFNKGAEDPKRDVAQQQPRFIEILLEYIMSPLALALTVVLLIWSAKTVFTGEQVSFVRISSISVGFSVAGLWLHIMLTHGQSGLAKVYRKVFPLAAIVILIFEARELFVQIQRWGMKTAEYSFIMIWIVTMAAAILLIVMKNKAHVAIAALVCGVTVFSVLPAVGYHALPVTLQINRLEKILIAEGMFENGSIVPAASRPDQSVREAITDAVDYLAYAQDAELPSWFDKRLNESAVFKNKLGFEQTWPDSGYDPGDYVGTYLSLPSGAFNISGYQWAVNMQYGGETMPVTIEGEKGVYQIYWSGASESGIPVIRIELDGRTIHEENMDAYLDRIIGKYPPGGMQPSEIGFEDMSYAIEIHDEAKILLVFDNVSISKNRSTGHTDYWLDLSMLYMSE